MKNVKKESAVEVSPKQKVKSKLKTSAKVVSDVKVVQTAPVVKSKPIQPISKRKPISSMEEDDSIIKMQPIYLHNVEEEVRSSSPVYIHNIAETIQVAPVVVAKPAVVELKVGKVKISEEIWNSIKDRDLGLFGLANQTVQKYCTPMDLDPNKCMMKYKVSSVIPALETVVPDFAFEVMGAYIVISKKV